jgi:MFS family permease
VCSNGVYFWISTRLDNAALFSWGWRLPFLASAVLVLVGLYVRLKLVETPEFERSIAQGEQVRVPFLTIVSRHPRKLVLGMLGAMTTYLIFYLMTVFALNWATSALKFARGEYLVMQIVGVLFFGLTIPISALIADRIGGRAMLIIATLALVAFGFAFTPLFSVHDTVTVGCFLALGFALTGFSYGPLSSALASLFPTAVRYTGSSLSFNFAGVLGASLAPYAASRLALAHGIGSVGLYLSTAALVSLIALILIGPSARHGIEPAREPA